MHTSRTLQTHSGAWSGMTAYVVIRCLLFIFNNACYALFVDANLVLA